MKKRWTKKDEDLLHSLLIKGKNYVEISIILKRTKNSLSSKIKKLGLTKKTEWSEEEIDKCFNLLKDGKSFKDIGEILGKSQVAVTRKMHRLGLKSGFKPNRNKGKTKYSEYDWREIQKEYDDGLSYSELLKKFHLSSYAIIWAKNNNQIKMRTNIEGLKIAREKGKFKESNKDGIARYRQLCKFKFSVKNYPNEFDLKLIEQYGWYQATNRGNNLNGISRDHIISVQFGFKNNIDPKIMSHPANCKLMRHVKNQKKNTNSEITLEELKQKIKVWNDKYEHI